MIPKRKYAIIALALSLLLCAIICVVVVITKSPSKDQAKLTEYINKHEEELIKLADQYPNQYKDLDGYLGIKTIDTRTDSACYHFSWSNDIPEGGSFIYYSSDGVIEVSGHSFAESSFIDGLGINGKGYIKCVLLKQNWFFVEYYLPT